MSMGWDLSYIEQYIRTGKYEQEIILKNPIVHGEIGEKNIGLFSYHLTPGATRNFHIVEKKLSF